MLVFQVIGMFSNIVPRTYQIFEALFGVIKKFFWGPKSEGDRFAAAVWEVMRQDPHILARKYCDRWLVKVHQRGLNGRELLPHEIRQQILPFKMPSMGAVR